jgi:hypothetical protein
MSKKGWGLWVSQWSEGIVDWTLQKRKYFDNKGIKIPDPLMLEWDKLIQKKKEIRNDIYLSVRN